MSVWTSSRSVLLLALVIAIAGSASAQRVGTVRGWFSTLGCTPPVSTEPTLDGRGNVSSERDGPGGLAERAAAIAASLPPGRAQELAQELNRLLAPRSHLKYVCKDETETGYVIRYPEGLGTEFVSDTEFAEYPYEVPNLGRPEIEFNVDADPSEGVFIYSYHVSNGIGATRPIRSWSLVGNVADRSLRLAHPVNWNSHVSTARMAVAPQAALYEHLGGPELMRREPLGDLPGWTGLADHIDSGETVRDFTAISKFRPGWTTAYLRSKGVNFALPLWLGEFPEAVQDEILFLHRWENRLSSAAVIGPRFSADAGREAIAENWQTGIQTMVAHGWLSKDSPYVVELLQFLKNPALVDLGASIRSEPTSGMEARLDKIVRMAFSAQ